MWENRKTCCKAWPGNVQHVYNEIRERVYQFLSFLFSFLFVCFVLCLFVCLFYGVGATKKARNEIKKRKKKGGGVGGTKEQTYG